ncbi:hypothetical protein [Ruegeria sp. AD91A]|uniref:hypothetical protein n=1 Tax=Ruegeria sp. AD91A TaxID=2293862 RepID=UPI0013C363B0|nr:hypothetical protein [Ruegeria sp. AD91A]
MDISELLGGKKPMSAVGWPTAIVCYYADGGFVRIAVARNIQANVGIEPIGDIGDERSICRLGGTGSLLYSQKIDGPENTRTFINRPVRNLPAAVWQKKCRVMLSTGFWFRMGRSANLKEKTLAAPRKPGMASGQHFFQSGRRRFRSLGIIINLRI